MRLIPVLQIYLTRVTEGENVGCTILPIAVTTEPHHRTCCSVMPVHVLGTDTVTGVWVEYSSCGVRSFATRP